MPICGMKAASFYQEDTIILGMHIINMIIQRNERFRILLALLWSHHRQSKKTYVKYWNARMARSSCHVSTLSAQRKKKTLINVPILHLKKNQTILRLNWLKWYSKRNNVKHLKQKLLDDKFITSGLPNWFFLNFNELGLVLPLVSNLTEGHINHQ